MALEHHGTEYRGGLECCNVAEEDVSRKKTSLKPFDKLLLNLAENDAEEEISDRSKLFKKFAALLRASVEDLKEKENLVCAAHLNPAIAKKSFPDRKRKTTAQHLVLRRESIKKWLKDRTIGDECCFELERDKRFAMEKNPLRVLPCFNQR